MQLQIETISVCQASCGFCPYPTTERAKGAMRRDLFIKIMDEAQTIEHIDEVCLTGLGEPMLDRSIVEHVLIASNRKPKAVISIYTNGSFVTPGRFEGLKAAGLTSIHFSLNAVNAQQHRMVMGLKDWDDVIANIEYAIAHRGNVHIEVKAVVNRSFSKADADAFIARWGWVGNPNGGFGQVVYEGNWAGEIEARRMPQHPKPNDGCHRALRQLYVLWDGKVTTCCFDPVGKNKVFGDLNVQTLREVYNGPEYLAFREAHAEDQADKYEFCKVCTRI